MIFKNRGFLSNYSKKSIYNFSVNDLNNKIVDLNTKRNKIILIVNSASSWGLTKTNLENLDLLYNKYNIGVWMFPSNQFNQEKRNNVELKKYVVEQNIKYDFFGKITLNGENEEPLYNYLKYNTPGFKLRYDINWNYTKFLCVNGKPVKRFEPIASFSSIEEEIKKYI